MLGWLTLFWQMLFFLPLVSLGRESLSVLRANHLTAYITYILTCLQRAIRVRSHSMETMVGSQKKHHSGGIPGSLSGGITHNSGEITKTTFSVSTAHPGTSPDSQRLRCLKITPLYSQCDRYLTHTGVLCESHYPLLAP